MSYKNNDDLSRQAVVQPNALGSFNAHANPSYQISPDDQELDNLSKVNNYKSDASIERPSFKARLKFKSDKGNYERAEALYSLRKSIKPELETVIKWRNLMVEVLVKGKTKKILDNVSGEVNNVEIQAILGPSGAGKTTLLNTIAGRIKEYNGSVDFYSKDKQITFAYVPQVDQLPTHLTVKESLLFSSRLRNAPGTNHSEEVEFVLTAFNLWNVRNNYASRCSGGERKRLSISLEMISKPNILILGKF